MSDAVSASGSVRPVPTRDAILDAAEALFAAHGYHGTSLQQIGEAAALSRGTPGYFFKTKERLYRVVIGRLLDQAKIALEPTYSRLAADGHGLDELVGDLVRAHLVFLVSRPAFVRLLQRDALADGVMFEELRGPAHSLTSLLADLSERYGDGSLTAEDAAALVANLAALCIFPFAHAEPLTSALDIRPMSPEFVEAHVATITSFVILRLGA